MASPESADATVAATQLVVELLIAAIAVALVTKKIRIPYTVALVLVGLGLGFGQLVEPIRLSKEIILLVFLPPLLFEGAVGMDLTLLRERWLEVLLLVGPVTIVSFVVTGWAAQAALGVPWLVALYIAAILSPTDPVSVIAMFREVGVAKRLSILVEAESIFNDGIGVVLFLVMSRALRGGESTLLGASQVFAVEVAGGLALGTVLGYAIYKLLARIDDHLVEVMISIGLAYGSYLLAERVHVSGVMAVVAAGLIIGNYGTTFSMSPTTRLALSSFWEVAAFIANSLVFLLMGIALQSVNVIPLAWKIGAVFGALLVSRQLAVYAAGAIATLLRRPFPWSARHLVGWAGLRGALPIALVLGASPERWTAVAGAAPAREELLTIVFGVVLASLIVQGLSVKSLVVRLGLIERSESGARFEREVGRRVALLAAETRLRELRATGQLSEDMYAPLAASLEQRATEATAAMQDLSAKHPGIAAERREAAVRAMRLAERAALEDAFRRGAIGEEAHTELRREIDAELAARREGH